MSSPTPAAFGPPRWLLALMLGVLLMAGLGLLQELTAPAPQLTLLIPYGFISLLAIAAIAEALISTVRVGEGKVVVRSLLGGRAIPLDRVDYVKTEGPGIQLRMRTGEWVRLPPPDWIRVGGAIRRRIAAEIDAAVRQKRREQAGPDLASGTTMRRPPAPS